MRLNANISLAMDEGVDDEEGLSEVETLEELCRRLVRSRRDPEFTPVQYLAEILLRLQKLEQSG